MKLPSRLKAAIARVNELSDPIERKKALEDLASEVPEKYRAAILVDPKADQDAWQKKKQELMYSAPDLTGDALAAFHQWEKQVVAEKAIAVEDELEAQIAEAKRLKDYARVGQLQEQLESKLNTLAVHGVTGVEKVSEYNRRCREVAMEAHLKTNPLLIDSGDDE